MSGLSRNLNVLKVLGHTYAAPTRSHRTALSSELGVFVLYPPFPIAL